MAVRPSGESSAEVPAGIVLSLASYGLFTLMDTLIKILGGRYHVVQVMFFNGLFAFLAVAALAARRGRLHRALSPQWRLHLLRWSIGLPGGLAIFWCYPRMPLADVYAILFAAPLFMTALSQPLLGERVGWRRWSAVLFGFSGVVVMLRPGEAVLEATALAALFGALVHAVNMLLLRKMRGVDPPEVFAIWGNGLSVLATGVALPWVWIPPEPADLGLHALAGTFAGTGFMLLVTAYAKAPAAVLAPFQYAQMIYGLVIGLLLFGDRPDPLVLLGAGIVVASGLYIFRREAVRRLSAAAGRPPSAR
ncbi:MAG: DMT family transporter [Geminicoccaceae bacterium]|nr:DMT family transporter [Geminicoccaceae bacterium]MDW8369090.1 DMT family transporter [Geminicoccaceae bacterium]